MNLPRYRIWPWALLGVAVLMVAGLLLLGPGGRDDVYKTLWPAEAFAATGRIVNYNGDAVEQSSSLLHVLVLGAVRTVVGGSLANLNLGLTLLCGALGIWLALGLARALELRVGWVLALALGTQGCWVYWSMGGLDGVLSGVCWLLWLRMLILGLENGRLLRVFVPTVLLVLVRPENGLIALGALGLYGALEVLGSQRLSNGIRRIGAAWLMVLLAAVALVAWRLWHGGAWLPQSALAKSDGLSWPRMRAGVGYLVLESYRHLELVPLWLGIGLAMWRLLRRKSLSTGSQLLLAVIVTGLAFVMMSGGDWMENGRFLVPFVLLLIVQLWLEIGQLAQRWQLPIRLGYVAANLAGLLWIAAHFNIGYSPLSSPAMAQTPAAAELPFAERYNKVHLRDAEPFQHLLALHDSLYRHKGAPVEILSQQAGYMMYHLALQRPGQFHFVDLVSLCTRDFTDCAVTQGRGRGRGGLNMDLLYLMDDLSILEKECGFVKPDIVFGLDDADLSLSTSLQAHGYRIVYLQQGSMPSAGVLQGMEMDLTEFLAVRGE